MRKIHFWAATNNINVASYRIRCRSIVESLAELGHVVTQSTSICSSAEVLILSKRYDEKTLRRALSLKKKTKCILMLDICDNHLVFSENSRSSAVKKSVDFKRAIEAVDQVIFSSPYLRDSIDRECKLRGKSFVIEDYIEQKTYPRKGSIRGLWNNLECRRLASFFEKNNVEAGGRLIWFGNHEGRFEKAGMVDLLLVKDVLEKLGKERAISLTVLSNSRSKYNDLIAPLTIPTAYIPWKIESFSSILEQHDVSIIPCSENMFTKAKTANRVTTSLVHGLQVIADDIPSYREFTRYIHISNWEENLNYCVSGGLSNENFNPTERNRTIIGKWEAALGLINCGPQC